MRSCPSSLVRVLCLGIVLGFPTASMTGDKPVAEEIEESPELTRPTEKAIERGLRYLARAQNKDGSWFDNYHVAHTSLSLMAFMTKGYFPGEEPHGQVLDKALDYLLKEAKTSNDGYLGVSMYAHGLATLALSELWGMSGEKDDDVQKALEAAVSVTLRAQNMLGGWRYNPQPTDSDLSVTVMQCAALASARQAGMIVPDRTGQKAVRFIGMCWEQDSGGFGYQPGGGPGPARSAGAVYSLILLGERGSEQVKAGRQYLWSLSDNVFKGSQYYYYTHYYAIQAMVQSSDTDYKKWYPQIRDGLLSRQRSDGSWGKGHSTAMAIITLGTPYRFIPIYQR